MTAPAPRAVLLDLFPAFLEDSALPPPHRLPQHPVRVLLTAALPSDPPSDPDLRLTAWADTSAGPAPVLDVPVSSAPAPHGRTGDHRSGTLRSAADPSRTFSYGRAGGCGCGSALRSLRVLPDAPRLPLSSLR